MKQLLSFFLFFSLVACSSCSHEPGYKFTLTAVDFDRRDFPVSFTLPDSTITNGKIPALFELEGKKAIRINCQYASNENELSWVVEGITKAGQERNFELRYGKMTREAPLMDIDQNDSTLFLKKAGKPVLHYRHSILPAPEGQTYLYERSGFIHPLYSPSGEILTWAQPADHYHHTGLWNPWTKVTWKGNHTDFWNLGAGLGTVRFKDLKSVESGPVFAEFQVLHDHIAFLPPKSPAPEAREDSKEIIVMEEEWIIRVWNIEDGYLIDFTSLIRNVLDESISLDAYRYGGGIGYRATSKWNKENSNVLTSEGKTRADGDATRAKWCCISGDLEGIQTGVVFLADPDNYDFPQPMRIWPEDSNGAGYQFFEFTPIREKAWILEPGKTYSQKYRIWVFEGQVNPEQAEQQWLQYIEAIDQNISYLSQ